MWDVLTAAPVIVKVLGALLLILVINRLCGKLIVSVAVGALVLAVWSEHSAGAMGRIAWGRVWSLETLLLMVVIWQVIALSSQMSASGVMEDLLSATQALVSRRASMAVLPAVIGLLPMPGGALFSAPLVDSCDPDGCLHPQLKTLTNHWFRHIWEYWWPIYPGVLLAMKITGLDVWQFMLMGIPLSICAVLAGWLFLLRRVPPDELPPRGRSAASVGRLLVLLLPIGMVIGCYAVVRLAHAGLSRAWPATPGLNRYAPMLVGLCGAMLVLQLQRPLPRARWREVLFSSRAANMVAIVMMVLIYGAFIDADLPDGRPLVAHMHAEMNEWGIPVLAVVMLLPLVSGLATGLSMGFVGASFPIVMSLAGPDLGSRMGIAVLAYGFGFVGQLLSPVHVCLVVTSEYFKTQLLANVVAMLKPVAVVLAGSLLMYFILS